MLALFLLIWACLCSADASGNKPELWLSPSSHVTSGDSVTVACRASSLVQPVTWSHNGVDVFITSRGPIIVKNPGQYLKLIGRVFTTLRGGVLHHVILTANDIDDDVTWQCRQNETPSNTVVMKVDKYVQEATRCADRAGCILGITSGFVLAVLVAVSLLHLYKQRGPNRKRTGGTSGPSRAEEKQNVSTVAPLPDPTSGPIPAPASYNLPPLKTELATPTYESLKPDPGAHVYEKL